MELPSWFTEGLSKQKASVISSPPGSGRPLMGELPNFLAHAQRVRRCNDCLANVLRTPDLLIANNLGCFFKIEQALIETERNANSDAQFRNRLIELGPVLVAAVDTILPLTLGCVERKIPDLKALENGGHIRVDIAEHAFFYVATNGYSLRTILDTYVKFLWSTMDFASDGLKESRGRLLTYFQQLDQWMQPPSPTDDAEIATNAPEPMPYTNACIDAPQPSSFTFSSPAIYLAESNSVHTIQSGPTKGTPPHSPAQRAKQTFLPSSDAELPLELKNESADGSPNAGHAYRVDSKTAETPSGKPPSSATDPFADSKRPSGGTDRDESEGLNDLRARSSSEEYGGGRRSESDIDQLKRYDEESSGDRKNDRSKPTEDHRMADRQRSPSRLSERVAARFAENEMQRLEEEIKHLHLKIKAQEAKSLELDVSSQNKIDQLQQELEKSQARQQFWGNRNTFSGSASFDCEERGRSLRSSDKSGKSKRGLSTSDTGSRLRSIMKTPNGFDSPQRRRSSSRVRFKAELVEADKPPERAAHEDNSMPEGVEAIGNDEAHSKPDSTLKVKEPVRKPLSKASDQMQNPSCRACSFADSKKPEIIDRLIARHWAARFVDNFPGQTQFEDEPWNPKYHHRSTIRVHLLWNFLYGEGEIVFEQRHPYPASWTLKAPHFTAVRAGRALLFTWSLMRKPTILDNLDSDYQGGPAIAQNFQCLESQHYLSSTLIRVNRYAELIIWQYAYAKFSADSHTTDSPFQIPRSHYFDCNDGEIVLFAASIERRKLDPQTEKGYKVVRDTGDKLHIIQDQKTGIAWIVVTGYVRGVSAPLWAAFKLDMLHSATPLGSFARSVELQGLVLSLFEDPEECMVQAPPDSTIVITFKKLE
ncbi:hypothetical protein KEM54_006175, partial [Ascosphaera aggregata]